MGNLWLPNGTSGIEAATLGNILTLTRIRAEAEDVIWTQNNGYIVSQAGSVQGTREWGLYSTTNSLFCFSGGLPNNLGSFATLFGGTTLTTNLLTYDWNITAATVAIEVGGVPIPGSPFNIGNFGGRDDGCLFRIGARGSSAAPASGVAFPMVSGNKIGTVRIYTDDGLGGGLTLVRTYEMPTTGSSITESTSGQTGTLINGTGGSADWEVVAAGDIVAPDIGDGFYSVNAGELVATRTLAGTYTTLVPTSFEYRIMQGVTEYQTWGAVDSYGSGVYSITTDLPAGEDTIIEVRADDGVTFATDATGDIVVGVGIALEGSSSSENMATDGTRALTAGSVVYFRPAGGGFTRRTSADGALTGTDQVYLADTIAQALSAPVFVFAHGLGGTRIDTDWAAGQADHTALVSELSPYGVTAMVSCVGYNDAYAGVTTVQATIDAAYENYRSNLGCDIFCGFSQRNVRTPENDAQFIALWQAQLASVNSHAYIYPVYRIDLEISGDDIHLTVTDSLKATERFTNAILFTFAESSYYKGPAISSAGIVGDEITVSLDNSDASYSAVSPATGIAGFQVLDDGSPVTINSVVTSGADIVITLAATPSGTVTLNFAGYDSDVSGSNAFANYPLVDSAVVYPLDPIFSPLSVSDLSSVVPDDIGFALVVGSPVVDVLFDVAAGDIALGVSIGQPSIGLSYSVDGSDVDLGLSVGEPAVSVVFDVAAAGVGLGFTLSAPSVDVVNETFADDVNFGLAIESPLVDVNYSVSPANIAFDALIDVPSVDVQISAIASDIAFAVIVDSPLIDVLYEVDGSDIDISVSIEQPTISIPGQALPAQVIMGLSLGVPSVDVFYSSNPESILIDSAVSSPDVSLVYSAVAESIVLGVSIGEPAVDVISVIAANDIDLALLLGSPDIDVSYAVSPDSISMDLSISFVIDFEFFSTRNVVFIDQWRSAVIIEG